VIGRTLAHYRILEKIGAGGMGEVYRATDTKLGRAVAVKVLPADVASHAGRLERFRREATTVAALNHPNIVTLHSIEEEDGRPFLVMELLEGRSLDRLVVTGGLPVKRALELAIPLAAALVAAHEKGIVHRDLKPGNVMVTADGRVKVLDFGLAKLTGDAAGLEETRAATVAAPISTAGQVVGTVPYMAPEQVRGEPADARTDVFALGVLLYELLTGKRPFTGESPAEITSAILRDAPPPPTHVRADLPGDLDRIVGRCLEKDPLRRLQTMRDLRNELEIVQRALERGGPAAAMPVPPPTGGLPPTSPPASSVAAGSPPSAPGPAPSVAVLPFANRSRDEEDEYFTDGLADELISVLARIRGLKVASRTSSFQFKGKHEDVSTIGGKLGVATCLEGSVRKAGDRLRVAVQLVNVTDGFPLWSETYDRTLDDIFAVQDDIAQSVVRELRHTLLGEEPNSGTSGEVRAEVAEAARGRGTDTEAHRLYLQGSFLVRRFAAEELRPGLEYLRRAVERDPSHALAWAWLSRGYTSLAGWGMTSVEEGNARAREAAERALAVEPDLSDAHVALGMLQLLHERDWEGARVSARRALELAPDDVEVLILAGTQAASVGSTEEAVRLFRRATERDPLNVQAHGGLGRACRSEGRLEEAEAAFRAELELSPQGVSARMRLAVVLTAQGRTDEALEEALRETADWARSTGLAIVHHARGESAESDAALQRLMDGWAEEAAAQVAMVHAFRGEADSAFEWLQRAYDQRDSGAAMLRTDPYFRKFHGDPRWDAFLRKMRLAG